MSLDSIDRLLRQEFPTGLPLGFAERVAAVAMGERRDSLLEWIFGLAPRAGMAFSAIAVVLALWSFSGDGPNVLDALDQAPIVETILSLP